MAHILQERGAGFVAAAGSEPCHSLNGCRTDDELPGGGAAVGIIGTLLGQRRRDDSVQRVKRARVLEIGQQLYDSPAVHVLIRGEAFELLGQRIQGLALCIAQRGQRPLVLRLGVLAEPAHVLQCLLEQSFEPRRFHSFEQRGVCDSPIKLIS